ncbi:hypothetical protein NPIL_637021 [Nephila pilipes]|uniref:Uncharacterized protein n=1 Tax=Nephila pilipes TaxID=299642 RepID=A0A8X6MKP4_NEPPI|nr:hypothetical protein NPIL_637021 [Nephila pilipes]
MELASLLSNQIVSGNFHNDAPIQSPNTRLVYIRNNLNMIFHSTDAGHRATAIKTNNCSGREYVGFCGLRARLQYTGACCCNMNISNNCLRRFTQ